MPTIHRRSRKIGRNEPCPCGRTKEVVKLHADHIPFAPAMKYKHCCGKIENQRMMAAVRRHIGRTIYNAMHGPKETSKLRKIVNFFKRDKK